MRARGWSLLAVFAIVAAAAATLPPSMAIVAPPTCLEKADSFPGQPITSVNQWPQWSPNGRYILYTAGEIYGLAGVSRGLVVRDRQTGALDVVHASSSAITPSAISADGRLVAFVAAEPLVPADTNGMADLYVRDRATGTTTRVSVGSGGSEIASGVAWGVHDVSTDGRYVIFATATPLDPADTNGQFDLYWHDRITQVTRFLGIDAAGNVYPGGSYGSMDRTGNRVVTYQGPISTTQPKTTVHTMSTGARQFVPDGRVQLSPNGDALLIDTDAQLVGEDRDALLDSYVYDLATGNVELVTRPALGFADDQSYYAYDITPDLRHVLLRFSAYGPGRHDLSVALDRSAGTLRPFPTYTEQLSPDGSLGLTSNVEVALGGFASLASENPIVILRGTTQTITFKALGIGSSTAFSFSTGINGYVVSNSNSEATLSVTVDSSAPAGPATVTVAGANGCWYSFADLLRVGGSATTTSSTTSTTTTSTTTTSTTTITTTTSTTRPPTTTSPGSAPSVSGVAPALLRPNSAQSVVVHGANFDGSSLSAPRVGIDSVVTESPEAIRATVRTGDSAGAIVPLTVTNAGGASTTLDRALLIRSAQGEFHPLAPSRLLDTRTAGSPIGPRSRLDVRIPSIPLGNAIAVVLNVTAVAPTAPSYLTVYPAGASRPATSSLNFVADQTTANLVTATLGENDAVSFYNFDGSTHLVIDIVGWYSKRQQVAPTYGGAFLPVNPARVLDTRTMFDSPLDYREGVALPIVKPGSPISAVMMNVTVTDATAPGYLTIWPSGAPLPPTSSINFGPGQTIANLVVSMIGSDGRLNIGNFARGTTEVIVDVVGLFENGSLAVVDGQYEAISGFRALDTRSDPSRQDLPLGPGGAVDINVRTLGVPDDASAVVINVTATQPTHDGYLTVYPGGTPRPNTSVLNFRAGQTVPNAVAMRIGPDRTIRVYNAYGATHVIVDVTGWFRPGWAPYSGAALNAQPQPWSKPQDPSQWIAVRTDTSRFVAA